MRWLLASCAGFLLAEALVTAPDAAPRLAGLYLPAVFVTGALAFGFRNAWARTNTARRVALAGLLALVLYGSLRWVRESEFLADVEGQQQRQRLEQLRTRALRGRGAIGAAQKSAPTETLAPGVTCPVPVSQRWAQSSFRTKAPRFSRVPKPAAT